MRSDVPWRDEVVDAPLEMVGGHVLPPTRDGIGVEVDEEATARHPYAPSCRPGSSTRTDRWETGRGAT